MTFAYTSLVKSVVTAILAAERPLLDEALKLASARLEMGHILPYFLNSPDLGMLPVLMVGNRQRVFDWKGLPDIAEDRIELTIWGMTHHDLPEINDMALTNLADAVAVVLNRRHRTFELPGQNDQWLFFKDPPIKQVRFGVSKFESSLVATFAADYSTQFQVVVGDPSP